MFSEIHVSLLSDNFFDTTGLVFLTIWITFYNTQYHTELLESVIKFPANWIFYLLILSRNNIVSVDAVKWTQSQLWEMGQFSQLWFILIFLVSSQAWALNERRLPSKASTLPTDLGQNFHENGDLHVFLVGTWY